MNYENTLAICILASHTERFIQERRFLRGVSPATEEWYRYSFKAFHPVLSEPHQSTTALKGAVIARIQALLTEKRGNKAVSINTYLRCLRAFLPWAHEESILPEPIKLTWAQGRGEDPGHIHTRPGEPDCSLEALQAGSATTLCFGAHSHIDTGLRVSELLGLSGEDLDMENLDPFAKLSHCRVCKTPTHIGAGQFACTGLSAIRHSSGQGGGYAQAERDVSSFSAPSRLAARLKTKHLAA